MDKFTEKQHELLATVNRLSKNMAIATEISLYRTHEPSTILNHLQHINGSLKDALDRLERLTRFDYGKLVDASSRKNPLSNKAANHVVTVEFRDGSRRSYRNVHYPEAYAMNIMSAISDRADFWSRTWVSKIYIDQVEYTTANNHRQFTQTLI